MATCTVFCAWCGKHEFRVDPYTVEEAHIMLHVPKAGVDEKINLQREGSKAKVYQVRQVRATILKYKLGGPA